MAQIPGSSTSASASPAVRAASPGWRDPRMWAGIVVVGVCVVAGARVLDASDDTVAIWAVSTDMGAGDRIAESDLRATRVRFADDDELGDYLPVAERLPDDLALVRGVGGGELLPRAALGRAADTGLVQLPVAVDPEQVPPAVSAGSVVDVYLVPAAPAGGAGEVGGAGGTGGTRRTETTADPALAGATVVDATDPATGLGPTGRRRLVLAVSEADAQRYLGLLGTVETPVVTVLLHA